MSPDADHPCWAPKDQFADDACRNRHCPKCQRSAAKRWPEARHAYLLPVACDHMVFKLPATIAGTAHWNKAVVCGLMFNLAAEVLQTAFP